MALPLASLADLEERLADPVDNRVRAEALLRDASAVVRQEGGTTWLDANGALLAVPDLIVAITVAMVQRVLTNPDQVEAESIDNYSTTYGNSSSDLYLKAAERRAIRRVTGRSSVGTLELETPFRITSSEPAGGGLLP